MDFMAIASWGTYPTPTPTNAQRAAYAASYGLLGLLPAAAAGQNQFSVLQRGMRRIIKWFA